MKFKRYLPPFVMWFIFETIAVTLWIASDNIFYLFNFSYIGTDIAIGLILYAQKKKYARNVAQFGVGLYMLVYLGFLCRESMQIEGFFKSRTKARSCGGALLLEIFSTMLPELS